MNPKPLDSLKNLTWPVTVFDMLSSCISNY
jgi:hypothetical protein